MSRLSTEQIAKMLGISKSALSRYILAGKVAAPPETMAGGMRMRLWNESDIERLRKTLPKIANGRKTRYKKKQSAVSKQQSAKTKRKRRRGRLRSIKRSKTSTVGQRSVSHHRTRPNRS